jgi:hypothetical protein
MNETVNDLHIIKNLLIEELNFLERYHFYAQLYKKNRKNDNNSPLLNEYYQHSFQASDMIGMRKDLLTRVNLEIEDNCNHVWETDLIDIDPDNSKTIQYCTKCEKNLE